MATPSRIGIPGTNQFLDSTTVNSGLGSAEREAVFIADPTTAAARAAVKNTTTIDSDYGLVVREVWDPAMVDAFARQRISNPVSLFDSTHQYGTSTILWEQALTGTGSVTHLPNESAVHLSTGGTASGAKVVRQTHRYHRYQPGKSQLVLITGNIGSGVTNLRKRIGYFDDQNGLYFEVLSTGVSVNMRSYSSGAAVNTTVLQASWNVDKLDGTGTSGITLDLTKAQIFFIDFEWLSVGDVRFGFFIGGKPVVCHRFANANSQTTCYMTTANLPVRVEIENTGVTSGTNTMKQICCSVISEGGVDGERGLIVAAGNGITTKAVTTRRPICSIRPKLTFNSITNRGHVEPLQADIYADSNAYFELVRNGTLTGASFASVSSNSITEFDTAATAISGGDVLEAGYVSTGFKSTSNGQNSLLAKLSLTLDMTGSTADIFTLVVTSFSGTANCSGTFTWKEQWL